MFSIIIIYIVFSVFSATELTDNYNVTKLLTMIILRTYLQKNCSCLDCRRLYIIVEQQLRPGGFEEIDEFSLLPFPN
jgi:hypothetical protein